MLPRCSPVPQLFTKADNLKYAKISFCSLSELPLRSKKSVRGSTNRRILLTQRMLATHRDNLEDTSPHSNSDVSDS